MWLIQIDIQHPKHLHVKHWDYSTPSEHKHIRLIWVWSVRLAEQLALPASDHRVTGSNPAGGEILPDPSLHRAFHVHPSIISKWLKYCWKGHKSHSSIIWVCWAHMWFCWFCCVPAYLVLYTFSPLNQRKHQKKVQRRDHPNPQKRTKKIKKVKKTKKKLLWMVTNLMPLLNPFLHSGTDSVYLMIIKGYFCLLFHKNICCGYLLELPCWGWSWGDSNEYPQHTFLWRTDNHFPLIITKYPLYLFHC